MTDVSIEQALFGYADGHRLLQSSTRLGANERDLLLQLSDMAPGVARLDEEGYFTGIALSESNRYAFLRTWPAPEMPRPGCVWSQVFLLPLETIRQGVTLSDLSGFFKRPAMPLQANVYTAQVNIARTREMQHFVLSEPFELVDCIYFGSCRPSPWLSQDALVSQISALWQQQSPDLRTRLSFRTVEKRQVGRSWLLNFDFMLSDGRLRLQRKADRPALLDGRAVAATVAKLAEDLEWPDASFAAFRDRYAVDLPLHPVWMAFLMDAWTQLDRFSELGSSDRYRQFLESVALSCPRLEEGLTLKTALVDFAESRSLELPDCFALVALTFTSLDHFRSSFPKAEVSIGVLMKLWQEERSELFRYLEGAPREVAATLIERLTNAVDAERLFPELLPHPLLMRLFVQVRPQLLSWSGLTSLSGRNIIDLIEAVQPEAVVNAGVVPRLVTNENWDVSLLLCERFPAEVVVAVCALDPRAAQPARPVEAVLRFVEEVAPRFLNSAFISRLSSTKEILSFATMLGFVSAATKAAGPEIWTEALRSAKRNSPESDLHKLQAFAVALGLATASQGSEMLLAFGFESIHQAMRDERLDYEASVMLEPLLPQLSWWRRWDSCHRFRVAVLKVYAYGALPLESFLNLAGSRELMNTLWYELETDDEFRQLVWQLKEMLANR